MATCIAGSIRHLTWPEPTTTSGQGLRGNGCRPDPRGAPTSAGDRCPMRSLVDTMSGIAVVSSVAFTLRSKPSTGVPDVTAQAEVRPTRPFSAPLCRPARATMLDPIPVTTVIGRPVRMCNRGIQATRPTSAGVPAPVSWRSQRVSRSTRRPDCPVWSRIPAVPGATVLLPTNWLRPWTYSPNG